ncbi:MAG: Ig-like domain-containing protein [Microcoleaceae cyanobacterium]
MTIINVTTTFDEQNNIGNISLREAIIQANSSPSDDTIILPGGTYQFIASGTGEDNARTGDLDILSSGGKLTIISNNGQAVINGGGLDRVFDVLNSASLDLRNITVSGGKEYYGGGIQVGSNANLNLLSCTINSNSSTGGGAGISSSGNLIINDSIITGNYTDGSGGGIYNVGQITINNSTISNNTAGSGAGFSNTSNYSTSTIKNSTINGNFASNSAILHRSGQLNITNSTISNNTGYSSGGIQINGSASLNIESSTITANTATHYSGGSGNGIYASQNSTINIANSIIAKNANDLDIKNNQAIIISQGNNLIGNNASVEAIFTPSTNDKIGTITNPLDPQLGPLQNNGGATATHALLIGSPAINNSNTNTTVTTDQRGYSRVGISDIGAYEFDGINQVIPDTTTPTVISLTPKDNERELPTNTDLTINFSEDIKKGTVGNVLIRQLIDNSIIETIDINSNQITAIISQLNIVPKTPLVGGIDYYVEIPAGAVTDIAGNNFAGITGNTAWNFRTADNTAPLITSITPTDGATEVSPTTDLEINFDEPVQKGNTGNILIKKLSDNTIVEDVYLSGLITVDGSQLLINPNTDLAGGNDYYIEISKGIVIDNAGNEFAGITGNTTWNFSVADVQPPTVVSFTPADGAKAVGVSNNLIINFSEPIQKGLGNILIKKLADNSTVETIVANASNITVSSTVLTINPTNNLPAGTDYYVEIEDGAIRDLEGNNFVGIADNSTWNFQTINSAPVANDDTARTGVNKPVTVNIKSNDSDAGGTISSFDLSPATTGIQNQVTNARGVFSVNNSGQLTFTPANYYLGTATLKYQAIDDLGGKSNIANISITVHNDGNDVIMGGISNDTLNGGNGNDTLNGADGRDLLNGGIGKDKLNGGISNDTLNGSAGDDTVLGGAGSDILNGGIGIDSLVGGTGNDLYVITEKSDRIVENSIAGSGNDSLQASVNYTLPTNVENGLLTENLTAIQLKGNTGQNSLTGNSEDNLLQGLIGNDTLWGGLGDDTLDGNDNNDLIWGDQAVTTTTRAVVTNPQGHDLIRGGKGNDKLRGQSGNDTLIGGADNDNIQGGDNHDLLIGDGDNTIGNDTLLGGAGRDQFMIGRKGEDHLLDFTTGQEDQILLSKAEFGLALPINRALPINNFATVNREVDADNQYLNTNKIVLITNGTNLDELYYKGNVIATLGEKCNTPIASDFLVVA